MVWKPHGERVVKLLFMEIIINYGRIKSLCCSLWGAVVNFPCKLFHKTGTNQSIITLDTMKNFSNPHMHMHTSTNTFNITLLFLCQLGRLLFFHLIILKRLQYWILKTISKLYKYFLFLKKWSASTRLLFHAVKWPSILELEWTNERKSLISPTNRGSCRGNQ